MSKHDFAVLLPSKRPSLSSRRPAWCGLGLVQIPPDVGQVEAIKGNASAPYGSAAIAGVVNLVSRRPAAEPIHEFLVNRSTLGSATDASMFLASPLSPHWSASLLGGGHWQDRRDVDGDNWATCPVTDEA